MNNYIKNEIDFDGERFIKHSEEFDLVLQILQHYHDECVCQNEAFAPEVSGMIQYYLNIVAQDLGYTLDTSPAQAEAMKERWDEKDAHQKKIIEAVRECREPKPRTFLSDNWGQGRKPS